MNQVAVLGSGPVGQALADGFLRHGYGVVRGTREPGKLDGWRAGAGPNASTGTFAEAAGSAEVVVLAVKGMAAEAVVDACGAAALAGKVVIDTTNPIADAPPVNGVLKFFTTLDESLMERLQRRAPAARFVKAFSQVGNTLMVNPELPGGPPTMFLCGNDPAARQVVRGILDQFGWETCDLGAAEAARAIEPLCMLWCIPGFTQNRWDHAFKLLQKA
jgi:8-hydroxy-5-deazaflavin:NADPH oxidoreductase